MSRITRREVITSGRRTDCRTRNRCARCRKPADSVMCPKCARR
jgi:hypothetical protein